MFRRLSGAIWMVALGHFTLELCHTFLPIVYPSLREQLGLSYAQIGLAAFVGTTTMAAGQPLFGYLADRWDARRVAALSVLWLGVIMGLIGFVTSYPMLIAGVALAGFGSAAFHPAGASVVSGATSERKGAALSIFAVGGNLGAALSPLLVALGLAWFGLRGTIIIIPVAVLVGMGLLWGLAGQARYARRETSLLERVGQGFALGVALLVVASMARAWFQLTLMTYLPAWLESKGATVVEGGQMLFIFSAAVGGGSLVGGALSDRVGRWQVLLGSYALLGPAFWLYVHTGGLVQVVFLASQGFLIGCTFPTTVVLAQELWPKGPALAAGWVMGPGWWPGGIGASFTGWLADRTSLDAAMQWLILAPLVAALILCTLVLALRNWQARLEFVMSNE